MAYMQRPWTYSLALRATTTTSSWPTVEARSTAKSAKGKIATTHVLIGTGLRPEPKDRTYPSSLDRSVRYSSFETFSTRSLPHHRRKPPASIAISQLSRPPGGRAEMRRLVCDREQERKPGIGSLLRDRGSFLFESVHGEGRTDAPATTPPRMRPTRISFRTRSWRIVVLRSPPCATAMIFFARSFLSLLTSAARLRVLTDFLECSRLSWGPHTLISRNETMATVSRDTRAEKPSLA